MAKRRVRKTRRKRRRRRRRRRTRRRRRRRTQRGGCTKCPWMPLKANFNPSPALPPGGGYEPGCTNGLRGGYYYNLNCPGGTCHPRSTVGELWPGYDGSIEKFMTSDKFSGGRKRRKSRRKSRKSRKSRKRRQRGGGPGVGASIRPPPIKQFLGRMVTNVRKITPGAIKNLARSGAYRGSEIRNAYYGQESGRMTADRSPDPMDQPIADIRSGIVDDLPQPGFEETDSKQPEVNTKMKPVGGKSVEGMSLRTQKKRH